MAFTAAISYSSYTATLGDAKNSQNPENRLFVWLRFRGYIGAATEPQTLQRWMHINTVDG